MQQKIIFLTILLGVGFSGNAQGEKSGGGKLKTNSKTHVSAKQTKAANKASSLGFFYFELTPTSPASPYYFSNVVTITYNDNTDLGRQQDDYMQKLRDKAGKPQNYNQKSSLEKSNFKDADDERKGNIKSLRTSGNEVIQKDL